MNEANKAILHRFVAEVLNGKNMAVFDELVAPDVFVHNLPPGVPSNHEGWKGYINMFMNAFPDMRVVVEDTIAGEVCNPETATNLPMNPNMDRVVLRVSMQGTHQGELMSAGSKGIFSIAATGKTVNVSGMTIDSISGGKIVEHWEKPDLLSIMQQIGAAPTPS